LAFAILAPGLEIDVRHEQLARIAAVAEESRRLHEDFFASASEPLVDTAETLARCLRAGGKLLLFGNGGSAADAQHIASEFVNRLARERVALAALALTTDSSALTSIANDSAYEQVYARQLEALGRAGDVAVAISTSGNSPNVVAALKRAAGLDLVTVGLLGRDGGEALKLCRHAVLVEHASTQRIQEIHIMAGHILVELVEQLLFDRVE
jgi:D-sedoheptulose 7-phosphate isomerase